MKPEEVLQIELRKYQSALAHLEMSFVKDTIPKSVYDERKGNLEPLIQQYKDAIETLKTFGK